MLCTSDCCVQVNRFLQQQGMRKEEVEREMERAYEQYFSSLAKKVHNPIQIRDAPDIRLNNPAFLTVLRSLSRWSPNYLRLGAGPEITGIF